MLVLHLGDVEGLHNALQAPLLELGALKASQEPLDVLGLQSAEPSGRGLIEAREVARHLVIAELVEALRDLEGLGEHAPSWRGGCGVLILLRGRLLLDLRHQLPAPLPRLPGHPGGPPPSGLQPGNLGIGSSFSSFARSSSMGTSSSGGFRSSRSALGGVSGPSAPAPPQGLHLPSAHPLAGIRGACSSSSALEKNRSSGA